MRICHFIPSDGIGGVETAAKLASLRRPEVRVVFLGGTPGAGTGRSSLAGRARSAIRQFLGVGALRAALLESDAAVFSLWKSCFLLMAWKLVSTKPAVLFIHCDRPFHWMDAVCTAVAMLFADGILTDSDATADARVPAWQRRRKPVRSVTMLLEPAMLPEAPENRIAGRFAFWGRFARQKRVDRALSLFAALKESSPGLSFVLIGPDDGELERCKEITARLGLTNEVSFLGPMDRHAIFKEVGRASFFLQLSDFEGFGISAAEAMQQGLVPVVTPVGEIGRYCVHMQNAVIFKDERSAVRDLEELLADADARERLSEGARATWASASHSYPEDFVLKVQEICGLAARRRT